MVEKSSKSNNLVISVGSILILEMKRPIQPFALFDWILLHFIRIVFLLQGESIQ